MKILFVHPSCLLYSRIYLRLEPLGLELVAAAARRVGHDVRVLDLQVFAHDDLFREIDRWQPEAVAFSLNYLANVPEVLDLARAIRARLAKAFIFVGGHSASFTSQAIIEDAEGAVDCVVRGDGEEITPLLLETVSNGGDLCELPGIVTADGSGPAPRFVADLNDLRPARDLMRRRRKYFIGDLDPCASIEFARGCPWDCSFCSAWTFYGRSYRKVDPEIAGAELESIREPHVFIVDDVAFIYPEHGMAIADQVEKRGIRKRYYLETRGDVLLKNREVFERWKRLGLEYMFLGIEAIDEDALQRHRKRISLGKNFEALEFARSLGVSVAVNIIVDPSWDLDRFKLLREWASSVPEIVNVTVNTPYPGTESWLTESRKVMSQDYRLYDTQHAILPTTLPLDQFYRELIETQAIVNRKHLGFAALRAVLLRTAGLLCRGQTNFFKMLWKFNDVYDAERQFQDHAQEVRYQVRLPEQQGDGAIKPESLYVHTPE
jgi:hopanoid C-3 methylase HpnR